MSDQYAADSGNTSAAHQSNNAFREPFKFYKSKTRPPDLSQVIDVREQQSSELLPQPLHTVGEEQSSSIDYALRPADQLKCFSVRDRPGLYIVADCLPPATALRLARHCLLQWPADAGHNTNLDINLPADARSRLIVSPDWPHSRTLAQLRWTTLGYQYDWTNKVYTDASRRPFPAELAGLCGRLVRLTTGDSGYQAQAAIVNYYPPGATLSPHVDHSEWENSLPLVSISIGRPAIYLTGGTSLSERPAALLLRSGDALVMTGAQRLVYHAVPRILQPDELPCQPALSDSEDLTDPDAPWIIDYLSTNRINLSVRQLVSSDS